MTVASAANTLVRASVTGFTSVTASVAIYLGSTLWFLLLVGMDARELIVDTSTDAVRNVYVMTVVGNCIMFTLQTINVWYTMFRIWPIVSIYYTMQFWVIGLRASVVALDTEHLTMNSLALLAQSLFTSSQLSVTLEYLYRRAYATTPSVTVSRPRMSVASRV